MSQTTFKDRFGREWDLSLTVRLVSKVKKDTEYDFAAAIRDVESLNSLMYSDPMTLGMVLFSICGEQAAKSSVDVDQFTDGFDGPTVFAACNALMKAIINFTHPPTTATVAAESHDKLMASRLKLLETVIKAKTSEAVEKSELSSLPTQSAE